MFPFPRKIREKNSLLVGSGGVALERIISMNIVSSSAMNVMESGFMQKINSINRISFFASLIAIILLASGIAASLDYSVGPGSDDWWTTYPDQSTSAGENVSHPSWVFDGLESKPVLIYVHKSCSFCKPQTDAIMNITEEFEGQIKFFEVSAEGNDARSEEALETYDPNNRTTMYVPLTVVLTLATDSGGDVVPVWHSTDEVTGDVWIKKYVEDAIDLHDENSDDWNR
jgi:hypothetical protein